MKIKYKNYWKRIRKGQTVDNFEEYLLHSLDNVQQSAVKDAMLYSLMAGGKRIRPKLLFHALKAYGLHEEIGISAACAIEMIHTYSLIHDDLPAMDNDTLRRGKPTCHVTYGEDIAILAGDALLTQAFYEISLASEDLQSIQMMCKYLAEYSGSNGMIFGQFLDLEGEKQNHTSSEQLENIHVYKTGKLITLPLIFAAILAGHSQDIEIWKKVGCFIGLSFQIQDDILDVTSSNEILGKNVQSDIQNNKATYVSLLDIDEAEKKALEYYEKAWDYMNTLHINSIEMKPVFEELIKRKY